MSLRAKRILALCFCCVLLVAAIYQNVRTGKNSDSEQTNVDGGSDEVIFVQDGNGSQEVGSEDGVDDGDSTTSADAENNISDDVATGIKCDNPLDYIAEMRIEREVVRSEIAEDCMAIIADSSSSEAEKTNAQEEVTSISTMMEIEDSLESSIKSRGYEDVFVIYDEDGIVDVTVIAKNMTESEVNTIAELVSNKAGIETEFVSMSSIY